MIIEVLDTPSAILGEGIFFDKFSCDLFWVDISSNKIFQYSTVHKKLSKLFSVPFNPSCILDLKNNNLIYTNSKGVASLELISGNITQLSTIPHNSLIYRCNDGTKLTDNTYIFGTMAFKPETNVGKIYKLNNMNVLEKVDLGISIPNTFIELEDEILISDSLKQITYSYPKNLDSKPKIWADFSKEIFTPDGGLLENNKIFIAMWGGAKITVMSTNGDFLNDIELPALQPTNCICADDNLLYVTTAREGLDDEQLAKYPLSGKTFKVILDSTNE